MKFDYDSKHDILRILFRSAAVEASEEPAPGFSIDDAADGSIVGLEILDASTRTENPRSVEFAETAA